MVCEVYLLLFILFLAYFLMRKYCAFVFLTFQAGGPEMDLTEITSATFDSSETQLANPSTHTCNHRLSGVKVCQEK